MDSSSWVAHETGVIPAAFFLPSELLVKRHRAHNRLLRLSILTAEAHLHSNSSNDSIDSPTEGNLEHHLSLLHFGKHLLDPVFIPRPKFASRPSLQPSTFFSTSIALGDLRLLGEALRKQIVPLHSHTVNRPISSGTSDGGTSVNGLEQHSVRQQSGPKPQTRPRKRAAEDPAENTQSESRKGPKVDVESAKKKQCSADSEYPDPFYAQRPDRYPQYIYSCSKGQRVYDFLKNLLVKHWKYGHFHDEFGERAAEVYWRTVDARTGPVGSSNADDAFYLVKRRALWGTDITEPIKKCPGHGVHEPYVVSKQTPRFTSPPTRPLLSSSNDTASASPVVAQPAAHGSVAEVSIDRQMIPAASVPAVCDTAQATDPAEQQTVPSKPLITANSDAHVVALVIDRTLNSVYTTINELESRVRGIEQREQERDLFSLDLVNYGPSQQMSFDHDVHSVSGTSANDRARVTSSPDDRLMRETPPTDMDDVQPAAKDG